MGSKKSENNFIWGALLALLIVFLLVQNGDLDLNMSGNKTFNTDKPESDLPELNEEKDCTDYDFDDEFEDYFGLANFINMEQGCLLNGGVWTSDYDEVSCHFPATFMLDCDEPSLNHVENLCDYLHGNYVCRHDYIGCLCKVNPPSEEEEEDEQTEYTCGWVDDVGCIGTCPLGESCEMVTYGQCACIGESGYTYGGIGTVFATSLKWSGAMGGLAGMDAKCQQSAANIGLPGTWKAIASDSSVDARDRIPDTTYYLLNGNVVANNKADLFDGSIQTAINVNEMGVKESDSPVWTGSDLAGNSYGSGDLTLNCHNWGWVSDGYFGIVGSTGTNGIGWIENTVLQECKYSARIYCLRVS